MPKLITRLYWYEGMSDWGSLVQGVPSVPKGTALYLGLGWINDTPSSIIGRVKATVVVPGGNRLDLVATLNQDKAASPGEGWVLQFSPVTLDLEGNYNAEAILETEAVSPSLFDGNVWFVNGNDHPSDWSLRLDAYSDGELISSMNKRMAWDSRSAPAPYTYVNLGQFTRFEGVRRIAVVATNNLAPTPSAGFFLMFYKPPGKGPDPNQPGLNLAGQLYFYDAGQQDVILT